MLPRIDPERKKVVGRGRPLLVVKPQGKLRFRQRGNKDQFANRLMRCKSCRSRRTRRGPCKERQRVESHGRDTDGNGGVDVETKRNGLADGMILALGSLGGICTHDPLYRETDVRYERSGYAASLR